MLNLVTRAAMAMGALALSACATPLVYGPIGAPGSGPYGYRDTVNPDGSYTLLVVANSAPLAHEYWDRRAGELCGGASFQKNIFRADIPVFTYTGYASNGYSGGSYTESRYGSLQLEGYLRCDAAPAASPPTDAAAQPPN